MKPKENKQPSCETYSVQFNKPIYETPRIPMVICDQIPELEMAVGFALNLHRSSNVSHTIRVMCGDKVEILFNRD